MAPGAGDPRPLNAGAGVRSPSTTYTKLANTAR